MRSGRRRAARRWRMCAGSRGSTTRRSTCGGRDTRTWGRRSCGCCARRTPSSSARWPTSRSTSAFLEGLQLRHRVRRRKHASLHRGIPPAASRAHERWSMDFVHDTLMDGRAFRALTLVDGWSRWSPILEVAQSMSGMSVTTALDRAIIRHGKPRTITVEHGSGFTIRSGKPTEDGLIDAFNGKLHRPHSSLGQLTPREHLKRSGREGQEAAFFPVEMDLRRDPGHPSENSTPAWSCSSGAYNWGRIVSGQGTDAQDRQRRRAHGLCNVVIEPTGSDPRCPLQG
jgi:putative transposase